MTIFFLACLVIALLATLAERWRDRPTIVVSTVTGESMRGRRALSLRLVLVEAQLLAADPAGSPTPIAGRVAIPRRNVALVQTLPATAPAADSGEAATT